MDPALIAVAGALATVATALSAVARLLYKQLTERIASAEADRDFWRERYLGALGLAAIATDVAEKKRRPR